MTLGKDAPARAVGTTTQPRSAARTMRRMVLLSIVSPRYGLPGRPDSSHGWFRVVLDVMAHFPRLLHGVEPSDEVERHVDPGRDAGRGHDLARVDEALVRPHVDSELAQPFDCAPVRGRGPALEQPGLRVDERSRADARHERARV